MNRWQILLTSRKNICSQNFQLAIAICEYFWFYCSSDICHNEQPPAKIVFNLIIAEKECKVKLSQVWFVNPFCLIQPSKSYLDISSHRNNLFLPLTFTGLSLIICI